VVESGKSRALDRARNRRGDRPQIAQINADSENEETAEKICVNLRNLRIRKALE
jgi:hypothetical protein